MIHKGRARCCTTHLTKQPEFYFRAALGVYPGGMGFTEGRDMVCLEPWFDLSIIELRLRASKSEVLLASP